MLLKLIAFSTGVLAGVHLLNRLNRPISKTLKIKLIRILSQDQSLNTQIQNALQQCQQKENLNQNDLKLQAIVDSGEQQDLIQLIILNFQNIDELKAQVYQNLQSKILIKGFSKLIIKDYGSKLQQKDEEQIKNQFKSHFINENDIIFLKQEEVNLDQKLEEIIHSWKLDLSGTIFEIISADDEFKLLQELSKKLNHQ